MIELTEAQGRIVAFLLVFMVFAIGSYGFFQARRSGRLGVGRRSGGLEEVVDRNRQRARFDRYMLGYAAMLVLMIGIMVAMLFLF